MTEHNTSRRRFIQGAGATLTTVGGAGLVATTASADGSSQGILGDGIEASPDYLAFTSGFVSQYSRIASSSPDIENVADSARNEFGNNSELWVEYGNWLAEEYDASGIAGGTANVTFEITRGSSPFGGPQSTETAIEAFYEDGEFTDLEWRAEPVDDPDFEATLRDNAAIGASDELQDFRREFIDSDRGHELPDNEWLNELAGRYANSLSLSGNTKATLEVLLGDVDGI